MTNRIAILAAIVSLMIPTALVQASEIWVQQSRGRITGGTPVAEENKAAKSTPEGSTTAAATTNSPTNPATCNQQNASSPACYSATQQTKGR